jgi:hypothetical protein
MRFTIPEILEHVSSKCHTHEEKVRVLRLNQSEPLEQILQYNFHPDIKMSLPEGDAPYKKEKDIPVGKSHSNLYREGRRLYLFLEGQAPNLKPYKKETLFIELLEGIHWTEADMLIAVKDKRLTDLYPGVTYEAARDAFDRLLPATPPKKVAKPVVEAKVQVTPVESPLDLPKPSIETTPSVSEPKPKKKREMTPEWAASIVRAREKAAANRAAKKAASQAE